MLTHTMPEKDPSVSFDDNDSLYLITRYTPAIIDTILWSYFLTQAKENTIALVEINAKNLLFVTDELNKTILFKTTNAQQLPALFKKNQGLFLICDLLVIPIAESTPDHFKLLVINNHKKTAILYQTPANLFSLASGFFTAIFSTKPIEKKEIALNSLFQTYLPSIKIETQTLPYHSTFDQADNGALIAEFAINIIMKNTQDVALTKSIAAIRETHQAIFQEHYITMERINSLFTSTTKVTPNVLTSTDDSISKKERRTRSTEKEPHTATPSTLFASTSKKSMRRFAGQTPEQAQVKVSHHPKQYGKG